MNKQNDIPQPQHHNHQSLLLHWFKQEEQTTLPRILILDGGVSTHLEESILQSKKEKDYKSSSSSVFTHRKLWSSSLLLTPSGKKNIQKCHEDFYNAGCDICSTVTYQCHYLICKEKGGEGIKEERVDDMLRDGVLLAREAAAECVVLNRKKEEEKEKRLLFVAASIGCYGAALADGSEYRGNYGITNEQLYDFHQRKVWILSSTSPDILAFETIPCIEECIAILQVLKQQQQQRQQRMEKVTETLPLPPPPPATWLSLACCNGSHLNDGSKVVDALKVIKDMDPNAEILHGVGINCCSFVHVIPLVQLIVKSMIELGPIRALVFYPNSGEEWDASTETWVKGTGCTSPDEFASLLSKAIDAVDDIWNDAVANGKVVDGSNGGNYCARKIPIVIGGCCRTSPSTIAAIRKMVDQMDAS